jgi:hypothetical protein
MFVVSIADLISLVGSGFAGFADFLGLIDDLLDDDLVDDCFDDEVIRDAEA